MTQTKRRRGVIGEVIENRPRDAIGGSGLGIEGSVLGIEAHAFAYP
jgi:hypothetical protein